MNAIILAAGDGTRMGRLTTELPKPLIDVNGISIIERQINNLRQNLRQKSINSPLFDNKSFAIDFINALNL